MVEQWKNLFSSPKAYCLIKQFLILFAGLLTANLIAVNFIEIEYVVAFDAGIILFWLCYHFIEPAFYLMVFFSPFVNWEVIFGSFNAPIGDVLAVLIGFAWLARKILNWEKEKLTLKNFPAWFLAALFIFASGLSLINAMEFLPALKYLLRPIIFFYAAFVVLPFNLIKTKNQLQKIYWIFFMVGLVVAIMGLLSLFTTAGPWYTKRAMPLPILGNNLLGGNQNAIAEVLVAVIPFTLILLVTGKKARTQGILMVGLILMSGAILLTFSRSGWLALLLEMVIAFIFSFSAKIKKQYFLPLIFVFLILPIVLYYTAWQNVDWVQSSNQNRLLLTEISLSNFLIHPVIGNGLNSFRDLVSQTFAYIVEFGEPLESHGFVQKILVEQGLLGFISFSALLLYFFRAYFRAIRAEDNHREKFVLAALLMMLSGLVLFELFSTSYYIARMWLPIGIGLAAVRIYGENNKKGKIRNSLPTGRQAKYEIRNLDMGNRN